MTTTPLPPPGVNIAAGNWTAVTDCRYYTADQMQAYAQQARADLEAEVKRLREALQEMTDDYADRFNLESPSTNPGIKYVIKQARTALKETP